jgi:hypothetical protein
MRHHLNAPGYGSHVSPPAPTNGQVPDVPPNTPYSGPLLERPPRSTLCETGIPMAKSGIQGKPPAGVLPGTTLGHLLP